MRAVFGPNHAAVVKVSFSQLLWRDFFIAGFWRSDDPDVLRMFEVEIAGAIGAIDGAVDHLHVAFAFEWCRTRCRTRLRLAFRGSFRELFFSGAVIENDHLPVRRPLWTPGAARQSRKLKRLTTGHREHEQLRRIDFARHLGRAHEEQVLAVG